MKILLLILIAIAAYFGVGHNVSHNGEQTPQPPSSVTALQGGGQTLAEVIAQRKSNVQIEGRGAVARILADDNQGSRHQRFIVQLDSGQSVLVVHNIDLAPRIDTLKVGDSIEFYGEYVWNPKGGVLHWTHRDPAGHHVAGWIRHAGRTYQ